MLCGRWGLQRLSGYVPEDVVDELGGSHTVFLVKLDVVGFGVATVYAPDLQSHRFSLAVISWWWKNYLSIVGCPMQ